MSALLLGRETYNPKLHIEEWRRAANQSTDEPDQGSILACLVTQCICLYREIIYHLPKTQFPKDTRISLERSYGSLVLWNKAHQVSDGSLDGLMSKSRTVRLTILETLTSIGRTLTESMLFAVFCISATAFTQWDTVKSWSSSKDLLFPIASFVVAYTLPRTHATLS
jgi:hypothetical protein